MLDDTAIKAKINSRLPQLKAALVAEQKRLGIGGHQLQNLTVVLNANKPGVYRVRIRFKREGVFVHKGVGRGTTADKAGTGKRTPKPWFNPVVEKWIDELSEDVADDFVTIAFNSLNIK